MSHQRAFRLGGVGVFPLSTLYQEMKYLDLDCLETVEGCFGCGVVVWNGIILLSQIYGMNLP